MPPDLPHQFGKYMLLQRLGEGGMAEVLLARETALGAQRLVAVKRVHRGLLDDEDFVTMFLDEARILSGLNHPNIGHILDVGRVAEDHYLAMEYIQGRDLHVVMRAAEREGARVPLEIVVDVARQVCAGLDHAHRATEVGGKPLNIVHRDVTPDNVIVTFDGRVKLVDFGIARAENRMARTRAGSVKGKPSYMAPEHILGRDLDGRTDLFSLGVLLYRLTTGVAPFTAKTAEQTFRRVVHEVPLPPEEIVAGYPRSLSQVVMRALAKDPNDRFESAVALQDALDAVAAEHGYLPSPRRLGTWLASLFPDAVAAADQLVRDPLDVTAAATASYLSTSGKMVRPDDPFAEAMAHPTREDRVARERTQVVSDAGGRRTPAGANPPPFAGDDEDTISEDARLRARPYADEAVTVSESRGETATSQVWSLRDHWRHLPPWVKSPLVLSAVGTVVVLLLVLAVAGLRGLW